MKTRRNISFDDHLYDAARSRAEKIQPYVRDFSHYVNTLVALDLEYGLLEKYPGRHSQPALGNILRLPLLGEIPAGTPVWTDQRTSGETVTVPTESIPADLRKSAYALKVAGKSMENPAFANSIPDGSVIVVVNKPAKIGDIVVGLVDGHSTLKLLIEERGRKLLRSLNPHPRFRDIIPLSSLEIQGVFHVIAG